MSHQQKCGTFSFKEEREKERERESWRWCEVRGHTETYSGLVCMDRY